MLHKNVLANIQFSRRRDGIVVAFNLVVVGFTMSL